MRWVSREKVEGRIKAADAARFDVRGLRFDVKASKTESWRKC
jgi:hypothetical protein